MSEEDWTLMLRSHGIRPTANRIILLRALSAADSSLTLSELEHRIQSIDKSGLSRALSLFRQCHLVHDVEDGDGSVRYELCTGSGGREDDDQHVHFFCERCHHTFCLYDNPIPSVVMPEGYVVTGINYVVKGICPSCAKKMGRRQG